MVWGKPARVSSQFSAHVNGQVQGKISIKMPHTRQLRCNHRSTGRPRVTATPNTIHNMNSRCNARIVAANAEYTFPFPYAALFCCALVLAQRARCAAAILLRAARLIMRTGVDVARLVFAHRAFCASEIFRRAAADSIRVGLFALVCPLVPFIPTN